MDKPFNILVDGIKTLILDLENNGEVLGSDDKRIKHLRSTLQRAKRKQVKRGKRNKAHQR